MKLWYKYLFISKLIFRFVVQKQNNMNIQDLKNNRETIINILNEIVGEENVKEVINIMVNDLDCYYTSLEERINSAVSLFEEMNHEKVMPRKTTKLAELLGKIAELED